MKHQYRISSRMLCVLLSCILILTMFSACGKDENTNGSSSSSTTAASDKAEASSNNEGADAEEKDGSTTSASDADGKSTGATTKTTKKVATTAATVSTPKTPAQSGLNNKPSAVENATDVSQLSKIDPNQAAAQSYDTEVSVERTALPSNFPTGDYTYVARADYTSRLNSVWGSFTKNEKVKLDAQYMFEYLNALFLPIKENFAQINCNGYDISYCEDKNNNAVYIDITWKYYVDAAQYNTCKTKASQICSKVSGSTADKIKAVHDTLGVNTSYTAGVDGPYNCLVNHNCDCDGYTAAFKICMDILGIPCKAYATSDHIFNVVQVDGKWYVVDATFDDQNQSGFVYSQYFLVGSKMYSNYSALASLLSSTDYSYSNRKLVVYNESLFASFLTDWAAKYNVTLTNPVKYELKTDGSILVVDTKGSVYQLTVMTTE